METLLQVLNHLRDGFSSLPNVFGRASRATYGLSMAVVLLLTDQLSALEERPDASGLAAVATTTTLFLVILGVFFPLTIRRMHDINRSGWWLLLFGVIWSVALFFIPSAPRQNRWGPPGGYESVERALDKRLRAGERLTVEDITDAFIPGGSNKPTALPPGTYSLPDPVVMRRCLNYIGKQNKLGTIRQS